MRADTTENGTYRVSDGAWQLTSLKGRGVVFVLMGHEAQKVKLLLDGETVIEENHPSAPGRQNEFAKSGLFRRINDALGPEDFVDWGPC